MTKPTLKEIFTKPLEKPTDDKWYVVGFFSATFTAVIIGMPILFWSSYYRDLIIPMHNTTYGLLAVVPAVVWLVFVMWKTAPILTFSTNISLLMYADILRDKEKKRLKEMAKHGIN